MLKEQAEISRRHDLLVFPFQVAGQAVRTPWLSINLQRLESVFQDAPMEGTASYSVPSSSF